MAERKATQVATDPGDWQTVDPGDWQTVSPGTQPQGFGEQFMTRLGENVVGLGAPLADPVGTIKDLAWRGAKAVAFPPAAVWEAGRQIAGQTPAQNAADLAFNLGLAALGGGTGKVGGKVIRGVGTGLRGSLEATMAKPPQPGLTGVPSNIIRGVAEQFLPRPEIFTAQGGGPAVRFPAIEGVPEPEPLHGFKVSSPPKPSAPKPGKVVAPPAVKFRPAAEEPPGGPSPVWAGQPGGELLPSGTGIKLALPIPSVEESAMTRPPGAGKSVTLEGVHPDYAKHPAPAFAQARDLAIRDYLRSRAITPDQVEKLGVEGVNKLIAEKNAAQGTKLKPYDPRRPETPERLQHLVNRMRE